MRTLNFLLVGESVVTLLWRKCEDETHTPEIGTWESSRIPKTLEFDCRGQNTSHWGVLYIIGKLLKCKCRKWPCISHLDICSTSYDKKNQLNLGACRWSATHRWKAFKESYKISSNLILIGGLSKELWSLKVPGVQTGTVLGLLLGSPKTKSHSDVAERHRVYYMGEGGGFPQVRAVVSQVNLELPVVCPSTKGAPKCELTNLLVGLMQVRVSE
jgi:hypothetical protein